MGTNVRDDFLTSMTRRMLARGGTIVGIAGIVLAIDARLAGDYIGAGMCLAASASALGVIAYAFLRN